MRLDICLPFRSDSTQWFKVIANSSLSFMYNNIIPPSKIIVYLILLSSVFYSMYPPNPDFNKPRIDITQYV